MKEATGELNMTVITIVAIAAISAFFMLFIYPRVKDRLLRNVDSQGDTITATSRNNCDTQCQNRGFTGVQDYDDETGTCTCGAAVAADEE